MPSRRRSSRKQGYRKKGYPSKIGGYLSTASKALAVAYSVKQLLNVEYKSARVAMPTTLSTTPTITNATLIAQGDDFDDRQGRKVKLVSIRIKGNASQSTASDNATSLRVVVVRDNNGSTTKPIITDLYPDATAFINYQNSKDDPQTNSRFSILWDHYFILDDTSVGSIGWFDHYIELNSHVYFTGTSATDEGKGHIYVFTASNQPTNVPNFNVETVIKFLDN